jgi:hypothetical protein
LLREIRPWGPQDRIPNETIEYWREQVAQAPAQAVRTEVELWFHAADAARTAAYGRFEEAVRASGGTIIDHAVIPNIAYEGALIDIPVSEVAGLMQRNAVRLALCDDIMFLRPQAMTTATGALEDVGEGAQPAAIDGAGRTPIAALLDGIPVERHRLLDGRLTVDDPDDLGARSVVTERRHGTGMASLILHGDRNAGGEPLGRPIYVRPLMYAPGGGRNEQTHPDKLLIDVVYRAVKRMKEGDEEGEATAPGVFLINLSMGDTRRPFSGPISPWARLLDHLAEHYGVLFLVSAGNVIDDLPVPGYQTWAEFESATPEDREKAILNALNARKAERTLLSPAEALNVLTIGAWHEDAVASRIAGANTLDPFQNSDLPNISSALGLGHRRTIKPDLYLPGGREHISFRSTGGGLVIRTTPNGRSWGLKVGMPDQGGALAAEGLIGGTSAATALATRAGHLIYDALMDGDGGSLHTAMDPAYSAVVVKALMVHRAKWTPKGEILEELCGPHGKGQHASRRDNVARLMGYGRPNMDEARECAAHRATLVGFGEIRANTDSHDDTKVFRIPLPGSLERVREPRSVSLTLAWFSPINIRHQAYRRAKLEAGAVRDAVEAFGVKRIASQPSDDSSGRGAVFHEHYSGNKAVAFVDDGHLELKVWCREQAGVLDQTIKFGFAVTIEAGEAIPVYQEVSAKLGVRPRAAVRP